MASFTLKLSTAALEGIQLLIGKLLAVIVDQLQSNEFSQDDSQTQEGKSNTTLQHSSDSLHSPKQECGDSQDPYSIDLQAPLDQELEDSHIPYSIGSPLPLHEDCEDLKVSIERVK